MAGDMLSGSTLIDVAGGQSGGAARFRSELTHYLKESGRTEVELIGESRRVSPTWLMERERGTSRHARIAVNSVGFLRSGGRRIVLLRNALHFLSKDEADALPALPRNIRLQIPVVRYSAARADLVVVPTESMRRRVLAHLPQIEARITARFHPLSVPALPDAQALEALGIAPRAYVYCPSLPSMHKDSSRAMALLAEARRLTGSDVKLVFTVEPSAESRMLDGVVCVGRLGLYDSLRLTQNSAAVFSPTEIESFCYPLAEARALGVVSVASNRHATLEVAGDLIETFEPGSVASMARALSSAIRRDATPDAAPFSADAYFDWLLREASR